MLNQNYPSMWHDIADLSMYKKSSWNNLKTIRISVKGVKTNWSQPYYDRINHQRLIYSFRGVCCEFFLPYIYLNENILQKICICHIFEGDIAYLNLNKKSSWNSLATIRTSVKGVRAYRSHPYYGCIGQEGLIRSFRGVCYELFLPKKRRKKNYARTLYRHECEPIIQMLNTADRVVAWGVMPLLGGGLY